MDEEAEKGLWVLQPVPPGTVASGPSPSPTLTECQESDGNSRRWSAPQVHQSSKPCLRLTVAVPKAGPAVGAPRQEVLQAGWEASTSKGRHWQPQGLQEGPKSTP